MTHSERPKISAALPIEQDGFADASAPFDTAAYSVEFIALDEILMDGQGPQEPLDLHDFFQMEETGPKDRK